MKINIFQVDAFTSRVFKGNPAAVCVMDKWLEEDVMQRIALENNLSETAFVVKEGDNYRIRWFTPKLEVDLCGHATLASSHVLFNHLGFSEPVIKFISKSGELLVRKENDLIILDFPADEPSPSDVPQVLIDGLGIEPVETYRGRSDYMLVYKDQSDIERISPDFGKIVQAKARGVIVTAKGDNSDFVSRFFAPQSGVDEDPVTGSAHTVMIPYWSKRLNRSDLSAVQLSKRQGFIRCRFLGDRVEIAGTAVTYLTGTIEL